LDGVFHPSQVTEEYVARLLREYSALDCAQVFTLIKRHGGITAKNVKKRFENELIHQHFVRKVEYADRRYFMKHPNVRIKGRIKEQIICFWILLDYIGKADRHYATGTFTRISMEIGDKDYSIVHVPVGAEKLCSSNIAKAGETRYFVVVDDISQIPLIKGENIHSFATVSKTGRIQYYRK